jgi:DNA-binding Lrp family transcriptional regulator
MAAAYVKLCVQAGSEGAVKAALQKMKGVRRADLTAGPQDIIALVEGASYESILRFIVKEIRKIKGIVRTETNLVL